MFISERTVDDLLRRVIDKILKSGGRTRATRGETKELVGVSLRLTDPRARLSHTEKKGKVFSGLGELLWYLAKSDDVKFISYYLRQYSHDSEDGRTIYGAYGPRMFNMRGVDQIANVIRLLRDRPGSRRAVVQLFNAEDLVGSRREIPCTCTLQFILRANALDLIAVMRSNDAFLGMSHDVFSFTMLQEILARTLQTEVGEYRHFVGSLHLYAEHIDAARAYLDEGWQPTVGVAMPPMPWADPWPAIKSLLGAERAIRNGREPPKSVESLDPYWRDLVRLLQVFRACNGGDRRQLPALRRKMTCRVFDEYITSRERPGKTAPRSGQPSLLFSDPDETADEGGR
jgi:thymidylate synthase